MRGKTSEAAFHSDLPQRFGLPRGMGRGETDLSPSRPSLHFTKASNYAILPPARPFAPLRCVLTWFVVLCGRVIPDVENDF